MYLSSGVGSSPSGSRVLGHLALGSLLLVVLGFGPPAAASEESADKTLDVLIRVRMTWNDVGKLGKVNIWESGSARLVVGGRVKLEEGDSDVLSYVPDSLRATWNWRHVYRVSPDVKARDACAAGSVLSIETGNGGRALGPDDMTLQVILGQAAGMLAAAQGGSPDTDGVYVLMLHRLIDTTVQHQQTDCFPAPYPQGDVGKRHFMLHAQGAMRHGRIRGAHTWTQKERVSAGSVDAQILDFGPKKRLSGEVPDGNVKMNVSYRLGKPKALVIERQESGVWEDVTYEEGDDPWDVLPGERVELRAVLRPDEKEASDGRWTIAESVVEDWVVEGGKTGYDTATVDLLDAAERQGASVGFHWWGASGEKTVAVETAEGGRKRAEARFRLVAPETRVRTVVPLKATFQIAAKPNGQEELVCIVVGEPTITFRHEELSWTTPGETQYVQHVRADARTEMGPSSSVGSCMELHVEGLDTSYPYAPGPRAADNPGVPATTYDLKLSVDYVFEMFLMYRPDTEGAIWVPLRVVPWTWKGRAVRASEGTTWDCGGSSMSRTPEDRPAESFPTWTRVVTEDLEWSDCSD